MAADLFPAKKLPTVAPTAVQQYQQQNISNNNTIQGCNWQGLYPSIRERWITLSLVHCSVMLPTLDSTCVALMALDVRVSFICPLQKRSHVQQRADGGYSFCGGTSWRNPESAGTQGTESPHFRRVTNTLTLNPVNTIKDQLNTINYKWKT